MLCAVIGCGGNKNVNIEGKITLDGSPLEGVQVLWDQPDSPGGNSFAGRTDASGHFQLKSLREELVDPVAGNYRISLTTAVADRDATEHEPVPKERIPKKYQNGQLTFDLPAAGTTEANFALTTKK